MNCHECFYFAQIVLKQHTTPQELNSWVLPFLNPFSRSLGLAVTLLAWVISNYWVIIDRIVIFGWTIPLNELLQLWSVIETHFVFSLQQISVPRQDEWTRFVLTLTEINENREDVEELAAQRLAPWSP